LAELLAKSPAQLAAMGRAGRAHIQETYTVEHMCGETLRLYGMLLGGAEQNP